MTELSIRRIEWAGYEATTEAGVGHEQTTIVSQVGSVSFNGDSLGWCCDRFLLSVEKPRDLLSVGFID